MTFKPISKRKPVEEDLNIILSDYWENFSILFPKVTQNQFIKWISEDTYGGWEEANHGNAGGRRELKMLYATIRATKPKNILEIGTYDGHSTDHILLAAENNQKEGFDCNVTTVDINDYVGKRQLHNFPLRRLIAASLNHLQIENHYDFIMQDGDHNPVYVDKELNLFKTLPNLKTVWSHDYYLRGTLEPTFIKNKDMWSKNFPFKEEAYRAGFHIGLI
jgi:hypothetical protein